MRTFSPPTSHSPKVPESSWRSKHGKEEKCKYSEAPGHLELSEQSPCGPVTCRSRGLCSKSAELGPCASWPDSWAICSAELGSGCRESYFSLRFSFWATFSFLSWVKDRRQSLLPEVYKMAYSFCSNQNTGFGLKKITLLISDEIFFPCASPKVFPLPQCLPYSSHYINCALFEWLNDRINETHICKKKNISIQVS